MSRFVQAATIGILLLGGAGAYAARAWRLAHALPPEQAAAIPVWLSQIPLEIDDPPFHGTREYLEDRIVDLSGADHYAVIVYSGEDGGVVRLHVGAATGTDDWLHEPTVCLPAHGWTTRQTTLVPIWSDLQGVEPGTRIWRMMLHKAGARMLVYYWIQWGEHIVRSRYERRWLRYKSLLAGRNDQPIQIVILYTPLGTDLEVSEARVESLVRGIWPSLWTTLSPGAQNHASPPP